MSRLIVFVFLACFGISMSFAQDTAKKQPEPKTSPNHTTLHHLYGNGAGAKAAASDSAIAALSHQSLNSQYRYLIHSVYHYQQPLISALWKNASDTLHADRAKLKTALGKIDVQNKLADSLKAQLINQAQQMDRRKDEIGIFGIVLSKTTYNLVVWGLVVLFAIIAFAVIARSAQYRREAAYRTQLFTELEEEYKNYKTKAIDKEKKLARELQTERNKLDELLGRG